MGDDIEAGHGFCSNLKLLPTAKGVSQLATSESAASTMMQYRTRPQKRAVVSDHVSQHI